MTEEKKSSGAGKFFLGAALGAIAGAIAGKFIHAKAEDECECDEDCECKKETANEPKAKTK